MSQDSCDDEEKSASPPVFKIETPESHDANSITESHQCKPKYSPLKRLTCLNVTFNGILAFTTIILTFSAIYQSCVLQGQWVSMLESNRINREALVSVQRAFVFPKDPSAGALRDAKGNITLLSFRIVWENSGSTSTKDLTVNINSNTFDAPPEGDMFPDNPSRLDTPLVIGPKAIIYSDPAVIQGEELKAVRDGKKLLFVWGRARYKDLFVDTKVHRTRFAYKIAWNNNARAFAISMHNKFNCADEECDRQEQDQAGAQPAK